MLPSGTSVRLATHEWAGGAVAPTGHTYLESFDLDDGLPRHPSFADPLRRARDCAQP
ncbi:MAG: hypothetical protein DLM60_18365 [Pseudonocardiales bacterium]|nr:MAG: hypothetical protein DLM60_18365 [Pseudonocardiales bacterium]